MLRLAAAPQILSGLHTVAEEAGIAPAMSSVPSHTLAPATLQPLEPGTEQGPGHIRR